MIQSYHFILNWIFKKLFEKHISMNSLLWGFFTLFNFQRIILHLGSLYSTKNKQTQKKNSKNISDICLPSDSEV